MKSPGESIRHAKVQGEWAELRFITRALELKFRVSKPRENPPHLLKR
jgi:hypothetical protein